MSALLSRIATRRLRARFAAPSFGATGSESATPSARSRAGSRSRACISATTERARSVDSSQFDGKARAADRHVVGVAGDHDRARHLVERLGDALDGGMQRGIEPRAARAEQLVGLEHDQAAAAGVGDRRFRRAPISAASSRVSAFGAAGFAADRRGAGRPASGMGLSCASWRATGSERAPSETL